MGRCHEAVAFYLFLQCASSSTARVFSHPLTLLTRLSDVRPQAAGSLVFDRVCFPPYTNRKALDRKSFPATDAQTYVFVRTTPSSPSPTPTPRESTTLPPITREEQADDDATATVATACASSAAAAAGAPAVVEGNDGGYALATAPLSADSWAAVRRQLGVTGKPWVLHVDPPTLARLRLQLHKRSRGR